ncbi:prepilin-type N-terminal cleavage/methylation domain-containing protein [Helicobacter sp. 11S03491-1]|uniref:pilus assembly FimT family protein n=1 Tax=Helicobacter sp. 11S03491-1 TaxID=1476196 RepID=UPI000BA78BF3|nr:prepilin-type N-terminal cleavage/methylation domain-containing protein [Helicobacter sp. 11S03491-1]PAF42959.1 hypothetical protein BKH45_02505 [Helicobacter sp. 11S03491-1]
MRKAFSLFEMVIAVSVIGILVLFAIPKTDAALAIATNSLLEHILYVRHLALNDSLAYTHTNQTQWLIKRFPSIQPYKLVDQNPMWQIQFHLNGKYTLFSYSLYVDTPRFAPTTDYDGRPMSGDIIAISGGDRKCLSGYNNTNISDECKNNSSVFVRLHEAYGLENLSVIGDDFCRERRTARIYFDRFGIPYCGKEKRKLEHPFKIILQKKKETFIICILPVTGYSFVSQNKECV